MSVKATHFLEYYDGFRRRVEVIPVVARITPKGIRVKLGAREKLYQLDGTNHKNPELGKIIPLNEENNKRYQDCLAKGWVLKVMMPDVEIN